MQTKHPAIVTDKISSFFVSSVVSDKIKFGVVLFKANWLHVTKYIIIY